MKTLPTRSLWFRSACVVTLCSALRLAASWGTDPTQPTLFSSQRSTSSEFHLVSDGSGGAVAAWREGTSVFDLQPKVVAQKVDAQGDLQWGPKGVTLNTGTLYCFAVEVLPDGAGGAFLLWMTEDNTLGSAGSGKEVYALQAQHVDAAGTPTWADGGVRIANLLLLDSSFKNTRACRDGAGGFYVAAIAKDYTAHVFRIGPDGLPAPGWPSPLVLSGDNATTNVYGVYENPAGAVGGVNAAWVVFGRYGVNSTVPTVVLVAPGGVAGAPKALTEGAAFDKAVSDTTGGLWVMSDYKNNSIYLDHLHPDGTLAWPASSSVIVNGKAPSPDSNHFYGLTPGNGESAFASWYYLRSTDATMGVQVQRFAADGSTAWAAGGISLFGGVGAAGASSTGINPMTGDQNLIGDGSDGVIGLCSFTARAGTSSRMVVQRADATGALLWPGEGVTTYLNFLSSGLASDGANGAIIGFYEDPLYGPPSGQHVTLSGTLGSNSPTARIINISARASVGNGSDVLIPGFVVSGGNDKILIRAVGPTLGLAPFNVPDVLSDPQFAIYDSLHSVLTANDNWGDDRNVADTLASSTASGAFALPSASKDAATVSVLTPGAYTAVASGVGGGTGVGLVELYEVPGSGSTGRIVNMSVRAQVGTGGNILIPGFVIGGTGARTLLIRAIGPTLGSAPFNVPGVLNDPQISIYNSLSSKIGYNDNWSGGNAAQVVYVSGKVGAFPLPYGSKDAALVVTLGVGAYTAQVSSTDGSTGVCLVEIYELP